MPTHAKTATMTVERLHSFNDAWARGDVDTLMSFMTEDCVYSASVGPEPGRTYRGRDEVRRGFEALIAYDADGESEEGECWVTGARGAAEWSYTFNNPDGTRTKVRGCDLFLFRGDKIVVKDAYRKTTR
jgi:ketosteroid isomerase-like protein